MTLLFGQSGFVFLPRLIKCHHHSPITRSRRRLSCGQHAPTAAIAGDIPRLAPRSTAGAGVVVGGVVVAVGRVSSVMFDAAAIVVGVAVRVALGACRVCDHARSRRDWFVVGVVLCVVLVIVLVSCALPS